MSKNSRLIKETVEKAPNLITPKEVAEKTGIKLSRVNKTLQRLAKKHFISKILYGHYASNDYSVHRRGSMVNSDTINVNALLGSESYFPRIHSIRFTVRDVDIRASKWDLDLCGIKIKFLVYGNGTAQVFVNVDKDYSFDYIGFRLLTEYVLERLGVSDWDKVTLSSPEFNVDHFGLKLDCAKAIELRAFDGSFRRVYNKKIGLRDEIKSVGSVPLDKALTVLHGGVSNYNLLQISHIALKQLTKQNEHLDKREKFLADTAASMRRLVDAVVTKEHKNSERLELMETKISKLEETKRIENIITSSESKQPKKLLMRLYGFLNRDISLLQIKLNETNLLKRLGVWMNKEVSF